MKYLQGLALFLPVRRQCIVGLFGICVWVFAPVQWVQAQNTPASDSVRVDERSYAADSSAIMQAIAVFFDGLAAKDSTAMLSVSDPGMRVVLTSTKADGDPLMRAIPIGDFVAFVVGQQDTPMRETYWAPEVKVHDNLATVWIEYNFYFNDTLDHCGEDTFQFFRSAAGWKIIALADTQRRDGCVPEAE